MNRTVIAVIVLIIAVVVAGYFFLWQDGGQVAETGAAPGAGTAGEIPAEMQAAVDFCKEKGGTVETVVAAEGTTFLCATADGAKAEVSKFMADNKTE
jgi:hypothetical protein